MLARRQALGARLGAQARALGVLALGVGAGVGAQAWGDWACVLGVQGSRAAGGCAWARGRALQARGRRVQRQAESVAGWASGSSAQGARQAGRAAAGRAGRAGRAGDGRQARGQAWRGRAGARGWAHGARVARPAWAWSGRWRVADWASWASFGALCTWLSSGSVFGPGSTRYFPESPNEHCSL